MSLTLHALSIPVIERALRNLAHVLEKGAAHARARKIEPAVLLAARLYPDMLPLTRQVQIASDLAKGCASRLAGCEPPSWPDDESSFEALQQRIARTLEHVAAQDRAAIDGDPQRPVTIKLGGEPATFPALTYLQYFVLPNLYFHCTTAYAILRHNGVELGKADYMGRP